MAQQTFSADLDEIVRVSEERMLRVMRDSIHDVVEDAQQPVARGGRMRVDTGFLRASGKASLDGFPLGPDIRPKDAQPNSFSWDGDSVFATLEKMQMGDTFYFGWTAAYGPVRETYDNFLGAALQNWTKYVAANTERLRKALAK